MKLPTIAGVIERRVLVNYRIEPDALAELLPKPFRPQVVADRNGNEWAMGGICLIRLGRRSRQEVLVGPATQVAPLPQSYESRIRTARV